MSASQRPDRRGGAEGHLDLRQGDGFAGEVTEGGDVLDEVGVGPGAGVGPFHHYVFEFFALDTKLTLPANTTRDELMKAMDGHIIGKAAYVGRFHAVQ